MIRSVSDIKIAYIDDSAGDRALFKDCCEDLPVNLNVFPNVETISGDFNLVFTDLHIPGEDQGIYILSALKARYPKTPLIAVSGITFGQYADTIIENYMNSGLIVDFITKDKLTPVLLAWVIGRHSRS